MNAMVGLSVAALFGLTACKAEHVAYVHDVTLGVDLSFSTEGTGKFVVGFDREVFAIVPKRTNGANSNDVMSLTALSDISVNGIDDIKFNHVIATGTPAVAFVQDPVGLAAIRKALYGDTAPSEKDNQ